MTGNIVSLETLCLLTRAKSLLRQSHCLAAQPQHQEQRAHRWSSLKSPSWPEQGVRYVVGCCFVFAERRHRLLSNGCLAFEQQTGGWRR
jgi:hypothetical protein